MIRVLLSIIICLQTYFVCAADTADKAQYYRHQVNSFYLQDREILAENEAISASQQIINNRQSYSQNVIARAFSLLSYVACHRGDSVASLQFAEYGAALTDIDDAIKLDLLLKVASGHYAKGDYLKLSDVSHQAIKLAEQVADNNYHLHAIAYSIVAHALSADYGLAIAELNRLESMLKHNQATIDQISLLEIIAEAHFNLLEYENTIELLNRVIKLRFETSKLKGISKTYQLIARAYLENKKFDDAYNAYWEAKHYAEKSNAEIQIAHADLGLGQVLFHQGKFNQAQQHLFVAQRTFEKNNLLPANLTTKIALTKVLRALNQLVKANEVLLSTEAMLDLVILTPRQLELYSLLIDYYNEQKNYQHVVMIQNSYLKLYQRMFSAIHHDNTQAIDALTTRQKSKQLAMDMAEESELSLRFNEKYQQQKVVIILLVLSLVLLILLLCYWRWKHYRFLRRQGYDENELPKNKLANSIQTKRWYQIQYKAARKYQYNIAIGYLIIENWQELNFHFNQKTLTEVGKVIATIVNESLDEVDYSGEISSGEYLFLCPHQSNNELSIKLSRIEQAINTRFFANLGEYSVKVSYINGSPTIKDIDPYIFLSRLSESVRTEFPYQEQT